LTSSNAAGNGSTETKTDYIEVLAAVVAPVSDFTANQTQITVGGTVDFTDLSTNTPTAWTWSTTPSTDVVYVNSTSATSQNPSLQFNAPGLYTITLTSSNAAGNGSTETKTDYIEVTIDDAGLNAVDNNSILVYPNPTSDNVTIDMSSLNTPAAIVVKDVAGQIVLQKSGQGKMVLDLSKLTNGIYFVAVENEQGNNLYKIVKQ
jgi:PKD repeat protein